MEREESNVKSDSYPISLTTSTVKLQSRDRKSPPHFHRATCPLLEPATDTYWWAHLYSHHNKVLVNRASTPSRHNCVIKHIHTWIWSPVLPVNCFHLKQQGLCWAMQRRLSPTHSPPPSLPLLPLHTRQSYGVSSPAVSSLPQPTVQCCYRQQVHIAAIDNWQT